MFQTSHDAKAFIHDSAGRATFKVEESMPALLVAVGRRSSSQERHRSGMI
jgi:hypothetical protein